MIVHLATDHAGFSRKTAVAAWLQSEGYEVVDHGAFVYDEEDDFPHHIAKAARAVSKAPTERAVIFGGSGQGEAMMANRFRNVRCTVFYGGDEAIVSLSRQHNDANVLSLGARFIDLNTTKRVIWSWLHTESITEEKYARRNHLIETITKESAP